MEDRHDLDGFRDVSFQVGVNTAWSSRMSSRQGFGMEDWHDLDEFGDVTFQECVDCEGGVEVRWISDRHFGSTTWTASGA